MKKPANNLDLSNHRIFARDLDGSKAEKKGFARERSFLVALDPEEAASLEEEGWPVKFLPPKNDEEDGTHFMKVKVGFGKIPPKIVVLNPVTRKKKALNENTVIELNWIYILDVPQMIVRPYNYNLRGREGTSVWLNSIYVTKRVDPFEEKFSDYADEDDSINED